MVIRDFDALGIAVLPAKAKSILLVNANTVLARPRSLEALEAVTGRDSQFRQFPNPVHLIQLPASD